MSILKSLSLSLLVFFFLLSPALAQSNLQTTEYQIINLINGHRRSLNLKPLQYDAKASAVARQHSQEMFNENFFALSSPARGSLEHQLAYGRVSGRQQHAFVALDLDASGLFQQLKRHQSLLSQDITHAAIGLVQGEHPRHGKALWATVILLQYMAELDEVPQTLQHGQVLKLRATPYPGYKLPRLPITFPNGQVKTFYPKQTQNNQYFFEVPLNQGRGRYILELLLDKPGAGPKVASILPIYVGTAYPLKEPEPVETAPNRFEDTEQAAQYLLQRINAERQKHKRLVLQADQLLTYVAYLHSEDMAKRQFFAHINPDGQDPNARFQAQGGRGQVGENIAYDVSVEAAHQRLMNSPGHRANILHETYTHAGIGIYFSGKHFYITQLFQEKPAEVHLPGFKIGILPWMRTPRLFQRVSG